MKFPELFDIREVRLTIDWFFRSIVENYSTQIENFFLPLLYFLESLENLFLYLPWYVVLSLIGGISFFLGRNWKLTLMISILSTSLGLLGLWEPAMESTALMLASTLITILAGIPIGVIIAQHRRLKMLALPILDLMQTMPIFVYLIPFVMLLGPGKVPALLATIVFSVPPIIRLTNFGITHIDHEVIEAYTSFGSTKKQILFQVQLPLALPSIMAGINQSTMLALSMVVIASMIGAGGLGYQILQGIQRLEVGRGLIAGLGIVLMAVVFDRIAQSYGRRIQKYLKH